MVGQAQVGDVATEDFVIKTPVPAEGAPEMAPASRLRRRLAEAYDVAAAGKAESERLARELGEVRTLGEGNAIAIRELRDNAAKGFRKLALSHDAIMLKLDENIGKLDAILEYIAKSTR